MKTAIELAREAGNDDLFDAMQEAFLGRLVGLARAEEKKKWEDQTVVEIHEAVLAERKANAKVAKSFYDPKHGLPPQKLNTVSEDCFAPLHIEAAILARGQ